MYKVILIDDEPIIRKGLKNILNWKQFDCEICAEASDGMEGAELIRTHMPDIVITDIKMPEVDGLSMIREIKDIIPASKIIILTGYRDFNYAQEAIKLGAFDFLLKPSKIEDLTNTVHRAIQELKFQNDKSEEINKLKVLYEQNLPVLREKLLYDILYGINTNSEDIRSKMELFNLSIEKFTLIVIENENNDQTDLKKTTPEMTYNSHLYQFGIINIFEETFSTEYNITPITLNEKKIAFIVGYKNTSTVNPEEIQKKCMYLQDVIMNCFGFTVSIAISSEGQEPLQLSSRLKECNDALEHKFYTGNNAIICYDDMKSFFKCEDDSLLEGHQKLLLDSIKSGNEALVHQRLEEITTYIMQMGEVNRDFLKNFYWNTVSQINNIRISVCTADHEKEAVSKDISSLFRMIEKCDSIHELNSVLEESTINVASRINRYNNKSIKLIMQKALDYIDAHYHEQISLNEVAAHTYVSIYYISRMFRKQLGKNFVDYLNELRIQKAKVLLKDVSLKTYEVAEMVGIPDAHYFSKLFKKHENVTPSEYRDRDNTL